MDEVRLEYQIDRLNVIPAGGLYKVELALSERQVENPIQFSTFFYLRDPREAVEILEAANGKKNMTVRVERGATVKNWIYADGERLGDYIEGPFRDAKTGDARK